MMKAGVKLSKGFFFEGSCLRYLIFFMLFGFLILPISWAADTTDKDKPLVEAESAKGVSAGSARYVTIDFNNVDLQVFVKFVSELTGKNFVIDDQVKGRVTIISPKKISVTEVYKVFESVLEVYGFTTVTSGDIIKIVPSQEAKEKNIETRLKLEAANPEDRIVTQIISLDHANPDDMKKILDPLISKASVILSYPPTGMLVITDVLSNIKRLQDIISALDVQGVGEQISYIPMKYASAAEVVKSLNAVYQQKTGMLAPIRLVADERTNAVILLASEVATDAVKRFIGFMDKEIPKGESTLHVYHLQNANAEELAKVLMNISKGAKEAGKGGSMLLSKEIQVVADKATNTLVITAEREDYKILEEVIKGLDVLRPMVYIEALIMEVNVNKDFKLGVEWRAIKDTGSISGFDTGRTAAFIGSGGIGASGAYDIIPGSLPTFPSGFSLGILGAGITIGGITFPNIGAVLRAYQKDSDVSILSTPQILTIDNEEAEINVGKNVPYITRQEKSTAGIDYSNYEYKDVGVLLNITPNINDDNFVRLKVSQQVTKVIQEESATGLPTTLKRTAKTTIVIKDNETVVIGGLVGDSTELGTYKIPCLGNIPFFGWLFKSASRNREKTNLFVFLTPHIIRTPQDASAIYQKKMEGMGTIEEGVIKINEQKDLLKRREQPQTNTAAPK
jgi:general secretion pathway protein D